MKSKSNRIFLALAALAVLALLPVAFPPRAPDIFGYLPDGAVVQGLHRDIRATWKSQLRHPAVAAFLAGYGEDAEDAVREDGALWTFRLAVGEDVASALLVLDDGRPCLAAASPTGRRDMLLHLFWLIRWVPGLGRIHVSPDGIRYIDLSDDDPDDPEAAPPSPLILSVALRRGVLLAKLADRPESLADMLDGAPRQNGLAAAMRSGLPDDCMHRLFVRAGAAAALAPGLAVERDIMLDISRRDSAVVASATFPVRDDDETLRSLLALRVAGRSSAADALAGAHAFALTLLPAQFAAGIVDGALKCGRAAQSGDDAAIYLTGAPYGAQFFIFAIPAVTASIPGISLDASALKAAARPFLPKQARSTLAVLGGDTICSSAASLERQRHAGQPPPFTWRDAYGRMDGPPPSAFLFLDCDPLFHELRQIAQALVMADSFAHDAIGPGVAIPARHVATALPVLPTGVVASAALAGAGDGLCRLTLILDHPEARN